MKNDINIIKNELIEQSNEKKQREVERKQAKEYTEFKLLCKHLVYNSIFNSLNNGASLENIYLQRNDIINTILQDIKSKYIEVNDQNSWDLDKKIKVRQYNYPDYQIVDILSMIFDSEYLKAEKRQKKEQLILKKELKNNLYNYFVNTFEYCKQVNGSLYGTYINFKDSYYKNKSIEDNADNELEVEILNDIYYKTLNEAIKGYDVSKPKATKQSPKLALPWKILAYKTAVKKIWKM